ncbi:MAG: hypothetical protein LBG71_01720 [Clostridiales Family XIII bacterium]|nr:hypothetical protein [Clostridiales Family XIII bacterium]
MNSKLWPANGAMLVFGVLLCYLTCVWENDFGYMIGAGLPFMVSGLLLLYGRVRKSDRSKALQLMVFNVWISLYAVAYFVMKAVAGMNLYFLFGRFIIQLLLPIGVILMMDAVAVSRERKRKKAEEDERQQRAEIEIKRQLAERHGEDWNGDEGEGGNPADSPDGRA